MKDRTLGLVIPTIGMDCMQYHLDEITKQIEPGNDAMIVFDRVAWHTTKKLRLPKNLYLLRLSALSPELNPTEQVWQVLRDRYLANRCFESYDHIIESCFNFFQLFFTNCGKASFGFILPFFRMDKDPSLLKAVMLYIKALKTMFFI